MSANDDIDFDFDAVTQSDHRVVKRFRLVLNFARGLVGLAFIITLLGSLWLFVDTSLQDQFYSSISTVDRPAHYVLPFMCLAMACVAASWFWVLHMLNKIVGTLIDGDPFIPANISRLRRMWIVIALTEFFRMLVVTYTGSSFSQNDNGFEIRIGVWFLVFVIATLSEAFRYGARMRQEQELTI